MDEFRKTILGKHINIKHGFAFKGEHFSSEGKFILLTPGNFYESGGFKYTPNKEKFYRGEFPKEYICSKGDLVVAMTEQAEGLLGSTALVPADNIFLLNQRIGLIQFDKNIYDKLFLYYLFRTKSVRAQIKGSSSGTKVKHTSPKKIYDVKIEKPLLTVQQKIGELLYSLDSKIKLNNRINGEFEKMAKTLYDYWFVQFDFPDENGKSYKSSGGEMVFSEELKRDIPVGWEVESLVNIATYTNGIACQKFRPQENEEFYRVIKIREMGSGFSESTEFVSKNIPQKVIVRNGDILFAWSASLNVKIWTGGIGGLNQHIFKITSEKYPRFYYYFELLNYLKHFKMMAELRKTTMGHITKDHLKQSRIVIPKIEIIKKLEKKMEPLLEKIIINKEENQKLTELRDWLLPMLMNGQVEVV